MQNKFFGHQAVSQRLANKLKDWYKVSVNIIHNEDASDIITNGLTFTVSRCQQFDSSNGSFRLTHNSKLVDCTEMYSLVNKSSKNK
jgi:hypothetical protein